MVGGMIVPPAVDAIVYATHLEPGQLQSRRTGGLFLLNKPVPLSDVAEKTFGKVVDLEGTPAVCSTRRGTFVQLDEKLLGMAREVTRQELVNLVRFARSNQKVVLCPYLAAALAANSDAPVFGALDSEHMLDPQAVRDRLVLTRVLTDKPKEEIDAAAALVAGMKGITLAVRGKQ